MGLFQRCGMLVVLALLLGTTRVAEGRQIVKRELPQIETSLTDRNSVHHTNISDDNKQNNLVEIVHRPQFLSKSESNLKEKNKENNPMSYVESSQFRSASQKNEGKVQLMKSSTGKYDGTGDQKPLNFNKARKYSLKTSYSQFHKKSYDPVHTTKLYLVTDKSLTQSTFLEKVDKTETVKEQNSAPEIKLLPPHQEQLREFSYPIGILPANEEYDGNTRFMHSILYGFSTGF